MLLKMNVVKSLRLHLPSPPIQLHQALMVCHFQMEQKRVYSLIGVTIRSCYWRI